MSTKSKNFIVPLVVYPFDVMVSINETYDQFGKAVVKKWDPSILDDFTKHTTHNQGALTYVFTSESHLCVMMKLNNFKKDGDGFGTLAHEIFHAVEFVLRRVGLTLNSSSFEAYAYLIGYLTKEIYSKL